jgi:hypothetical protein
MKALFQRAPTIQLAHGIGVWRPNEGLEGIDRCGCVRAVDAPHDGLAQTPDMPMDAHLV